MVDLELARMVAVNAGDIRNMMEGLADEVELLRESREGVLVERDVCPGVEMVREAHEAFGTFVGVIPEVPELDESGRLRMVSWAARLAEMAQELKDEAAVANGMGDEVLGLLLIRVQLSVEETGEWAEALAEGDIVKAAHELVDMSYVTDGHYLALGLAAVKFALYREVHRANMSKLDSGGRPIVNSSGRWVKGPHYRKPDLEAILRETEAADAV